MLCFWGLFLLNRFRLTNRGSIFDFVSSVLSLHDERHEYHEQVEKQATWHAWIFGERHLLFTTTIVAFWNIRDEKYILSLHVSSYTN